MAYGWFPADSDWNEFNLPSGTEQEFEDPESTLLDVPQPAKQSYVIPSYFQSYIRKVDVIPTLDPHSLIAPPTNDNTGLGNQPMMSLNNPFSIADQPRRMTPVPHAERSSEQSVNPKAATKGRKPQNRRKSVQLRGNRSTPFRCGWKDCKYTGTFGRKAELMRHIDVLHVSPHSYDCPARGCRKVCNRADNLLEHIRRAHQI
ncbi:hypothetical protein BDV27DRAFT_129400 [Aspergillus caelatus]|uniref:C2H2-type domain-containing protein n=1 Tax=Aspergillus caelatus TaxID=61420 RepID=A0A5N7A1R4_9EURO|nr:uncharacterized protein BDV27DRAFT_129400 [Aspergillus caelatus]KAE8363804.1 hypothetical protein BDV27DRAFT_129400 [Aspergillus caelatus]